MADGGKLSYLNLTLISINDYPINLILIILILKLFFFIFINFLKDLPCSTPAPFAMQSMRPLKSQPGFGVARPEHSVEKRPCFDETTL